MIQIQTNYYAKDDKSWIKILHSGDLIDYINPIDGYHLDKKLVDVSSKKLPFYNDLEIIRIYADKFVEDLDEDICFFFVRQGTELIALNGSSENIYAANDLGSLNITIENCVEYLKFFCMFTVGDEEGNPFYILDGEHSEFIKHFSQYEKDKLLKNYAGIELNEENGVFYVSARAMFQQDVFDTKFEMTPDGTIVMLDDEHIPAV